MEKKIKIYVDIEKCKGCNLCIGVCPKNILKTSVKLNKKGFQYIEVTDQDKCISCGLCCIMCPDCALRLDATD